MAPIFKLDIDMPEDAKDRAVVTVGGFIDTTTAVALEERLLSLVGDGRCSLIVDLAGVDYVSSAGWGTFIGVVRHAREAGGDLCLAGMRPEVADVFHLLEFSSLLRAYPDCDSARNDVSVA